MWSEDKTTGTGRTAVVHVCRNGGLAAAELAAEACHYALTMGLAPLDEPAWTVDEVDTALAAHPDAVVVVHPGRGPFERSPDDGATLWNFPRAGAALRMCVPGRSGAQRRPARAVGHEVALPFIGSRWSFAVPGELSDDDRRRYGDCRAFAEAEGMYVPPGSSSWECMVWMDDLVNDILPHGSTLTVLIHPEVTAPDPGTPDEPLWRWLRQGREISSGRRRKLDPPRRAERSASPRGPRRPVTARGTPGRGR